MTETKTVRIHTNVWSNSLWLDKEGLLAFYPSRDSALALHGKVLVMGGLQTWLLWEAARNFPYVP